MGGSCFATNAPAPELRKSVGARRVGARGRQDDPRAPRQRREPKREGDAIAVRKPDIHEDGIRTHGLDDVDRRRDALRLRDDDEPLGGENAPREGPEHRVVVDDQYGRRRTPAIMSRD